MRPLLPFRATLCALTVMLGLVVAVPALAADPLELGQFGQWKAFSFTDGSGAGKVCFMSSKPQKQEGKFTKRGDVAFFITHWAAEGTRDVVSVAIGYPFKKGSTLRVLIDGTEYKMTTDGEMAWAADSTTDKTISEAVRRGSKLVVKGVSQRGTETTDTYSLSGSGDAYKKITDACGF